MAHTADIEHQLLTLKRYYCICLITGPYDQPYKFPGEPALQRQWQPAQGALLCNSKNWPDSKHFCDVFSKIYLENHLKTKSLPSVFL